jgi:hypothetical protein
MINQNRITCVVSKRKCEFTKGGKEKVHISKTEDITTNKSEEVNFLLNNTRSRRRK